MEVAFVVLVIALAIYGAFHLDKRWRSRHPEYRPFKWGYFQALWFFPGIPLMVLYYLGSVLLGKEEFSLYFLTYIAVIGTIGSIAGYTLLKERKKWAWVSVVILQFNVITWIVNTYYGSVRWKEFK